MTLAPSHTSYPPHGDGSILGAFKEAEYGKFFEFSTDLDSNPPTVESRLLPHLVWVGPCQEYRHALVLKTVAYVWIDDDLPLEKWSIRSHRLYQPLTNRK